MKNEAALAKHFDDVSLKRGIRWSILLHVVFIAFAILWDNFFTLHPHEVTPTLRVDLVALPDFKKGEAVMPTPPKPIAESKPKAEPAVKLKTPVKPDGDYSSKKVNEKKLQEKMKNALLRMKALAAMESTPPLKGNIVSKGSTLSGEAKEALETSYFDQVLDKLRDNWELPSWMKDNNFDAKVIVYVGKYGEVIRYAFKKSSGNDAFDDEIKQAIQRTDPFPAPPAELADDLAVNGILLGFPL